MSTNNKLSTTRVAVIGAGSNTRQRHIPGLASQDGVEVTGVCNRTRESSQRVADEFGIPRVYQSWNQAVEDPDVDAIVIGTWPYMHAPITLAALENGKHVLCEARMAMNREEARKMLDASRAHPELVAQVVPSPFTLEHDATMARLIQEICGPLLAIEGHFSQGGFVDPDAPYGVVALGRTFVRSRSAGASSSVRYTSIPDHLSVTAVTWLDRGSECWFFGEDGTVLFSNQKIFAGRRGDEQLEEQTIPDHERGCWRVEEEFLSAIRGEEPVSRTTFYEGYRYMEFTQAVQESMRTRMYVPIGA